MRVLFFGRLREAARCAEMECAPPTSVTTIGALRIWLGERDAVLRDGLMTEGVRIARDQCFCDAETPLADAREIAFMSPLSGG